MTKITNWPSKEIRQFARQGRTGSRIKVMSTKGCAAHVPKAVVKAFAPYLQKVKEASKNAGIAAEVDLDASTNIQSHDISLETFVVFTAKKNKVQTFISIDHLLQVVHSLQDAEAAYADEAVECPIVSSDYDEVTPAQNPIL